MTFEAAGLFYDAVLALESQHPETVGGFCLQGVVTFWTEQLDVLWKSSGLDNLHFVVISHRQSVDCLTAIYSTSAV